ncbi:MAG: M23 family metallopeptidase [Bdellovibrionales bacterium]|nr:M23 family metallopeptidase [Bdellovibrionales bacterium]
MGFNNFFKHPVNSYFRLISSLDLPTKKAPRLRLPASVWERVNETHKDQKQLERELIEDLLKSETPLKNTQCWTLPLNSKVVSQYSSPRTLPNNRSYLHSGVDLRARRPQPIVATADGTILFANKMVVPGNNILIDHGEGLFSRYMHLSKLLVHQGDSVQRGQVIGLTGATGRVEAPHLHWEVVWKGRPISPFLFLDKWRFICNPRFALTR